MKLFYDTEQRIQALRFHAAELIGTPFAAHAMVPGAGIDCVHVNAWVYLKTGFLKKFEPPAYALDEGQHAGESKLLAWLNAHPDFVRRVEGWGLQPGDAICFDVGKVEFHVGLMLDDSKFVHVLAMQRGRVIVSSLDEAYYKRRLRAIYRPMEH